MFGRKNNKLEDFYNKQSNLKHRLEKDVIRDGIAYLACKVDGVDDILSKFSVKGLEAGLNSEFIDALLNFVD